LFSFSKFKKIIEALLSSERLVATTISTWYQNYTVTQYVSVILFVSLDLFLVGRR